MSGRTEVLRTNLTREENPPQKNPFSIARITYPDKLSSQVLLYLTLWSNRIICCALETTSNCASDSSKALRLQPKMNHADLKHINTKKSWDQRERVFDDEHQEVSRRVYETYKSSTDFRNGI